MTTRYSARDIKHRMLRTYSSDEKFLGYYSEAIIKKIVKNADSSFTLNKEKDGKYFYVINSSASYIHEFFELGII